MQKRPPIEYNFCISRNAPEREEETLRSLFLSVSLAGLASERRCLSTSAQCTTCVNSLTVCCHSAFSALDSSVTVRLRFRTLNRFFL